LELSGFTGLAIDVEIEAIPKKQKLKNKYNADFIHPPIENSLSLQKTQIV
jgi:hypothetical protein